MDAAINIQNLVCRTCWELCFSTEEYRAYCQDTTGENSFDYTVDDEYTRESASKCKWCGLVLEHSTGWETESRYEKAEGRTRVQLSIGYAHEVFAPPGKNRPLLWVNGVPFKTTAFASAQSLASSIVTARPLRRDVTSDQSFREMKQWLRTCENHSKCQKPLDTMLPARVIDVGSSEGLRPPRIIETYHNYGKYAALSYRWGEHQSGITTRSNLADRLRVLETESLSKTVQEAILVTRNIGLQYLWCDAICLSQDNEEDVSKELKHMTSIFQSAYVTIVAANAPDSSHGFLKCPRQPDLHAIEIPFWSPSGELCTIHLRREDYYSEDSPWGWTQEPISTRCWAFQEKLLSTRRLIFASHTVQFQCREETINLGNSLHTGNEFDSWRLSPFIQSLFSSNPTEKITYEDAIETWKEAICQYSGRSVTYETDKLVALAALTEAFHKYIQTPYLAGLWHGTALPSLLLWTPTEDITSPFPTTYVAPSWSWASIQSPIQFVHTFSTFSDTFEPDESMSLDILSASTELKQQDLPYGKVTGGILVVSTLLSDATFILPTPGDTDHSAISAAWRYPKSRGVVKEDNGRKVEVIVDDPREMDEREVKCLAVIAGDFDITGCGGKVVEGLLVRKVVSQGTRDQYRRIGRFFQADGEVFYGLEKVVVELV